MELNEYVSPELPVLIPVIYSIGMILKKSKVKNKHIPLVLGIVSIILSSIWIFSNSADYCFSNILKCLFSSITQGILIAATSVYTNQLYTQSKKDE